MICHIEKFRCGFVFFAYFAVKNFFEEGQRRMGVKIVSNMQKNHLKF